MRRRRVNNASNIDKLEGRELDAAVAIALDNEDARQHIYRMDDGTYCPDVNVPRYHADIAAAWELDGEGWRWRFVEHDDGKRLQVFLHHPVIDMVYTVVAWEDFLTTPDAYAVARCRAWLKAQSIKEGGTR